MRWRVDKLSNVMKRKKKSELERWSRENLKASEMGPRMTNLCDRVTHFALLHKEPHLRTTKIHARIDESCEGQKLIH